MARFLHEGTRLYTHTTRAYKLFTNEKEMSKWHEEDFTINFSEGGIFEIQGTGNGRVIKSLGTVYKSYERESVIELDWQDYFCFDQARSPVEIRIMTATSETEYCTEIHVVHRNLDHLNEEQLTIYKSFWKGILGSIHKVVNRDWVISDAELTLDCFK
jgi:uncharacterized protein YndB with AHSA1/START domain